MLLPIQRIFVEKSVAQTEITQTVLSRRPPGIPVEYVEDGSAILRQFGGDGSQTLSRGKQALLLADFHVKPIKDCPGTPDYLCCGYEILNFASGCILDCSYCILQSYFSNPLLVVQANADALLRASAEAIRCSPEHFFRLGTGEFTDSLALDPWTGYAARLVEFVAQFPNAALELKSKAAHVEPLLGLNHRGHTICAWSVNSKAVIGREEYRVASLEERLAAAQKCGASGYKLAFHFDPIFFYPNWEEDYQETVEAIFRSVPADSIAWISLGCFRYVPGLEQVIRERFPGSRFTYEEFVLGGDRKMRYPQPLRVHIYKKMVQWIRAAGGENVLLYFCMENPQVWRSVLGKCPSNNAELKEWLDGRCRN